ncbi:TerC family protein [Yunchengibacter salinarum]|uniref:TerC family protein n=1 Tax=Yunchengibacter salinarum TaxID=3133399 RepID=UPI0035B6AAD8
MDLAALFLQPENLAALASLIVMEVVLGIDNLMFVSILAARLPEHQQQKARLLGVGLAFVFRILLLFSLAFLIGLTEPVITVFGQPFSWRNLIMLGGGLFLIWKATSEMHEHLDPLGEKPGTGGATAAFGMVVAQVVVLDLVFSIDSILTAIGMTLHLPIMVLAIFVSLVVMLLAARPLGDFVTQNPTVIMLALGFLLVIGMTLLAEGFGAHIPKGYIYAAIAFSAFVEALNTIRRRRLDRKRKNA